MFIGTADGNYRINWNEFAKISNFDYDSGYGGAEIPTDLIVYFKDNTYMFRWEYDGSEWWEYIVRKKFNETCKYFYDFVKNEPKKVNLDKFTNLLFR